MPREFSPIRQDGVLAAAKDNFAACSVVTTLGSLLWLPSGHTHTFHVTALALGFTKSTGFHGGVLARGDGIMKIPLVYFEATAGDKTVAIPGTCCVP